MVDNHGDIICCDARNPSHGPFINGVKLFSNEKKLMMVEYNGSEYDIVLCEWCLERILSKILLTY